MPSFLYPAFLIGAAAAAIPVLLHLLRNQQAPEMRFSAVRLLRGVRVEHAQRRRIRDWMLLALRISALLLLAIAFARPYLSGRGTDARGETILVVDRSASMSAPVVWERAKAAALRALDATALTDAIGLIAFDDRPDLLVEPTLDRAAVRAAIQQLRPGVGGTAYPGALMRAVSLIEDGNGRGRIVLVSDLQGSAGDARAVLPESIAVEIGASGATFENVALLGARRVEQGIVATVRNDGAAQQRVRLTARTGRSRGAAAPNSGEIGRDTLVDVPPGQTVESLVPASVRTENLTVRLQAMDGNVLAFDDERHVAGGETRALRVLVVAAAADAFYVDAALRAGGDSRPDFEVVTASPQAVARTLAGGPPPDGIFVLGPRGLDRGGRDALLQYVRNGGGVFIAASDPGFSLLVDGLEVSAPRGDDPIIALASLDARHPLFVQQGAIGDSLGDARFTRAWRVRARGWDMIARFDDGAGALFERMEGRGRLLFFASDLNRGWNDLPVQPAFVPFVQETARYLAPRQERREYTPAALPRGTTPSLGIVQLHSGRRVVVNPSVRESDPERMTAAVFQSALKRRPDRVVDPEVARRRTEATERGQALWRFGLLLMFATLVAEGLLGSRMRRA